MVYFFILFISYMIISTPFEEVISGFDEADAGVASDEIDTQVSNSRTAFNMAFGLAAIVPGIWFIVWVFHREPDWRYRE